MSIRDTILNAKSNKLTEVSINDSSWGVDKLFVKLMSGKERLQFQKLAQTMKGEDENKIVPFVIVQCVVDETGKSVFAADDYDSIMELNGMVIDSLFASALKVNGLMETSVDEAKKN